jgi:hypothetical protein
VSTSIHKVSNAETLVKCLIVLVRRKMAFHVLKPTNWQMPKYGHVIYALNDHIMALTEGVILCNCLNMRPVFIYTLTDPTGEPTFYVGSAYNPIARFRAHARCASNSKIAAWVAWLRRIDKLPIMTIMAECSEEDAPMAEDDALSMLLVVRGDSACLNTHRNINRIHAYRRAKIL